MNEDKPERMPNTPPFVRFVCSAIPMVFDDSLSYYEALCAMWKYVQGMTDVINNNATLEEEYIEKFNELKTFVDTYFDNLDVQEEINNKLDAMVEDGTLQEIITSYIQANAIWAFNTVSEMKSATNLIDGSYVETYGFYSKGDKGGAKYKIREITNEDTVDEAFIIALSDPDLVAELMVDENLYSKQIGLKGDGTTDETSLLNTFFAKDLLCNKIVNSGIYRITDTVYLKGLWRQNNGNNGQRQYIFENATLLYQGNAGEASVVLYNMFKTGVKGLCVARDSNENYVEAVGCWHTNFSEWDIQDFHIDNLTTNLEGKTYTAVSNEYISCKDVYILGTLTINAESTKYTNCINFYNCVMFSSGKSYCVELTGPVGKQEINFYNCDMSYATTAVFNVPVSQSGSPSVNCIGCYFDSSIKMFAGDNKNGVVFNNLCTMMVAYGNEEIVNIKQSDFVKNTNFIGTTNHGWNLPTMNVNLALNGNISSNGHITGHYNELFGSQSSLWNKSYVSSDLSPSGLARAISVKTLSGGSYDDIVIAGINAPRSGEYTGYVRFKVTAGSFNYVDGVMAGQHLEYSFSRIGSDEVVMVFSKENMFTAGDQLKFSLLFYGASSDLALEFYEVGIVEGKLYLPNLPLHANAVIPPEA